MNIYQIIMLVLPVLALCTYLFTGEFTEWKKAIVFSIGITILCVVAILVSISLFIYLGTL